MDLRCILSAVFSTGALDAEVVRSAYVYLPVGEKVLFWLRGEDLWLAEITDFIPKIV